MNEDKVYNILRAAMIVHNELGYGMLEAIYQEALCMEFLISQIPYEREKPLKVYYKGCVLSKYYVADFVCYGDVIVEVKALKSILPEHTAQVINYLRVTGLRKGLIINFGEQSLTHKSIIV